MIDHSCPDQWQKRERSLKIEQDFQVAEPSKCDDFWHDATVAKLSTFHVPKAGRRATFGIVRDSAKFWRHSAVSRLGSCTPRHRRLKHIVRMLSQRNDLKGLYGKHELQKKFAGLILVYSEKNK